MILSLFILLGILNLVEITTPLCRRAGILNGALAAGLQLQSSLSLVSRVINAFFLPLIGHLSDVNLLSALGFYNSIFCVFLMISIGFLIIPAEKKILMFYSRVVGGISKSGSLFILTEPAKLSGFKVIYSTKKFQKIKLMTFLGFIPQYLSWPVVFIFLSHFPENRGLILGLTSVLNGINSLLLIIFIDPYILKFENYYNISNLLFEDQIKARLRALACTAIIFIIISYLTLSI
jgi:hypothetical protein